MQTMQGPLNGSTNPKGAKRCARTNRGKKGKRAKPAGPLDGMTFQVMTPQENDAVLSSAGWTTHQLSLFSGEVVTDSEIFGGEKVFAKYEKEVNSDIVEDRCTSPEPGSYLYVTVPTSDETVLSSEEVSPTDSRVKKHS